MLQVYKDFLENYMAISIVDGVKTESEKFAGAEYTTTVEALMQDGKALQSGTSHMLGQNFAKSFDIKFLDENQQSQFVWQTSWGVSTRLIGAMIMTHSDDKGLILPPKMAQYQVVIIPIFGNEDDKKVVMEKVESVKADLDKAGILYTVDAREGRPGFKYFEWERKGVPLRMEIGPKDVANKSAVLVDRILGKKEFVPDTELISTVVSTLEHIQQTLLENSRKFRLDNTHEVSDYSEFKNTIENKKGFVFAHLCLDPKCEEKIKEETQASSRCIPFDGGVGNEITISITN